ncbi:DNA translocase FtsK [Vallitaleaceae bacterium 9-2]
MARTTKKQKHPSATTSLSMVQYEIVVMVVLAFALFIMVSIYLNGGGIIGAFFRSFFFGLLGVGAYILPIGIFVASFMKAFNKGNKRLNMILLLSFLAIIFISITAHVIYVEFPQLFVRINDETTTAFFPSLTLYFKLSSSHHIAGGLIGGLIGDFFLKLLGKIATILVLIVIFLSIFIGITEKSIIVIIKKSYRFLVGAIKRFILFISAQLQNISTQREKQKEKQKEMKTLEQEAIQGLDASTNKEKKPENKKNVADLLKATIASVEDIPIDSEAIAEEPMFEDEANKNLYVEKESSDVMLQEESTQKTQKPKAVQQTSQASPTEELPAEEVNIEQEILSEIKKTPATYLKPPIELLKTNPLAKKQNDTTFLQESATKLEETLASFGVNAKVIDVSVGPSVTRYELQPSQGVKVSKIVNLSDDIALNLAASGIRIEAPIPGKSAVGIEVPNKDQAAVFFREVIDSDAFEKFPSKVAFALGKDISGKVVITDIGRMPHLLIAGATGSGKSVCINTLITSILYKSSPEDVKLLMIDPKVVELSIYNGIPHLLIPVVTDPKKAAGALNWAVQEMLDRYKLFAAANVRDIKSYNKMVLEKEEMKKLPQIVIIVDELADLMVAAAGDVEEAICRLAQMARAAGLHLIIATQRPSVDVITGLIKANIPSRIAFNVSSGVDSRTIIDMNGAEKLLGKGDMLFYPVGYQKPVRIQGAFISDKEVENIVSYLKERKKEDYDEKIMNQLNKAVSEEAKKSDDYDEIFEEALELCVKKQKASASMIQRSFRVGYNRAARILDQLHEAGYVGDDEGSKPRKMLLSEAEFEALKAKANAPESDAEQENEQLKSTEEMLSPTNE